MLNTSALPQPRPRPGQQELTGYYVPAMRSEHPSAGRESMFRTRNIVCTAALLGLVALAVIAG
jgi:hypothetical protein